ncbi:hypothetical protein [Sneathiella sp.]|jgi:hypothetical protein|uniref:hypothetical protein n=1 Tax=Sneathiella sp. TaxID=1964365 RepID=UPI0039E72432
MKQYLSHLVFLSFLAAGLSACNDRSQTELLEKIAGTTSPEGILEAVGEPDEIAEDGALRHWRYKTSEGDVCYTVAGSLAMRMICS